MERAGFVGLGIMGRGMAANVLKTGATLTVWNRNADKMRPLLDLGAVAAASAAGVAASSDIVFLCVSDTDDVRQVVLGPAGLLEGSHPGSLMVDMSTIQPSAAQAIALELQAHGVHMLDAPVSGGSEGAAQGTLSIMIGGEGDQVKRARPFFEAMGQNITHVGPHGHGQMAKLVNQILVVGNALAMSEALLFAQAGGLDLAKTVEAVSGGAGGSWMLSHRGPQILARDWRPGFTIDLQQKDVRLALDEAARTGAPLLVTAIVQQLYRSLQIEGLGGEGNHALVKALEHLSGLTVGAGQAGHGEG